MDLATINAVPAELRPFLDEFAELLAKQAIEQTQKKRTSPIPDDEPLHLRRRP